VLAVAGYLYYSGMLNVPGLTTEATYVGISFSSNIQTSSPSISMFNTTINVETYKKRISVIAPPSNCTVRNSTRNCFMEKLAQYNISIYFYKSITISNNATGEIYFQKVFTFTSGEDRKIEILIMKPIAENATLKIDIHIEISITSSVFSWSKVIDRTIYTKTGTTYSPDKPYTSVNGILVQTSAPAGSVGVPEVKYLAIQIRQYEWVYPSMSFTAPNILIYIKYHGTLVSDPTVLGLTSEDIGKQVTASGVLSRDNYGNVYIEVEKITVAEVSIQG